MQTLVIRALLAVVVGSAILTAVIFVRVATVPYSPPRPDGALRALALDETAAMARLNDVLRLLPTMPATMPGGDAAPQTAGPNRLQAELAPLFPQTFAGLGVEVVGPGTLLLEWEGGDPSAPAILLAVSLEPPEATAAVLEAVEALLEQGVHPRRTAYLVLTPWGPDAGGSNARAVAERLRERDVQLDWVLGPGGGVATEMFPGIRDPLALVGVAEKGRIPLLVEEAGEGDHPPAAPSSAPGHGADGAGARVLEALAEDPLPSRVEGPTRELVRVLAAHADPGTRMLATNLWLFGRPLARALAAEPGGETMVRSHLEVRRADEGGRTASGVNGAELDLYLAPWDELEGVLQALRERVEPLGLEVTVAGEGISPVGRDASDVWSAPGFRALGDAILRSFPDALAPAPYLLPGPSDARHFRVLAREVYGFTPVRIDPDVLARRGETDDGLSGPAYLQMVRFYADFLARAVEGPVE